MTDFRTLSLRLMCIGALAWPAGAFAATSMVLMSDSISASLTEVSNSISTSSNSSSKAVNVAEGDYRITAVADAALPGKTRLTLEPANGNKGETLYMVLANADFTAARLVNGQVVTARRRPYGVMFAKAGEPEPFAVVLQPEWQKDVPTHALDQAV